MAEYLVQGESMAATADAIREKLGNTALIEWLEKKGFANAIASIETGGGGNFVVTEVTLASDYGSTTGKKICGYPLAGVSMQEESLFVMLVRKDTTEMTYSIPIAMACNTAYLNGSYALTLKRTSYGVSMSYKPEDADYKLNNTTGQGIARIYLFNGGVYIMAESGYSFLAGTYYLIVGVLQGG